MLNVMIHNHLVSMGYVLTAYAEDLWDDGDGESGPHLEGHPAYDVYESPDHRIVVDHRGHVEAFEDRDLAFEAWCDEMAGDGADQVDQMIADGERAVDEAFYHDK